MRLSFKNMQMDSKNLSLIRNKLKRYLKDKDILDIIVFGSAVKGRALPKDIDIAIIGDNKKNLVLSGFHVSMLKPEDFFVKIPSLVNTILREGYSLKNKRAFSQNYKFESRIMFKYGLAGLNASTKVKVVSFLRGKGKEKGFVKENNGEWLVNQVFFVPIERGYVFEKFFLNFNVKFKKYYILMH